MADAGRSHGCRLRRHEWVFGLRKWADLVKGAGLSIWLLAGALSGCATVGRAPADTSLAMAEVRLPDGSTGYKVGSLTVVIADAQTVDRECRFQGLATFKPEVQVRGCYIPGRQRLYSTPDPYVLLHEFKHHIDGHFHD